MTVTSLVSVENFFPKYLSVFYLSHVDYSITSLQFYFLNMMNCYSLLVTTLYLQYKNPLATNIFSLQHKIHLKLPQIESRYQKYLRIDKKQVQSRKKCSWGNSFSTKKPKRNQSTLTTILLWYRLWTYIGFPSCAIPNDTFRIELADKNNNVTYCSLFSSAMLCTWQDVCLFCIKTV